MSALTVVDDAPRTLDELAGVANYEHEQTFAAASAVIRHAIAAGEALLEAKARTQPGQWTRWLRDRFVASPETANIYMSIAHHQAEIATNDVRSISQARRFLREVGAVREPHGSHGRGRYVTEALREEARTLRSEGKTLREIGEALGFQVSTVHGWCNPETASERRTRQAKGKAQRREARRAVERVERDRLARKTGGSVAECYSLIRKACQEVDAASGATADMTVRADLNVALTKLHQAEDAIVRALGTQHGAGAA